MLKNLVTAISISLFSLYSFSAISAEVSNAGVNAADTIVSTAVKTALVNDAELKLFAIEVSTTEGSVTLQGVLPTLELSQKAVSVAQHINGVKEVVSKIEVK